MSDSLEAWLFLALVLLALFLIGLYRERGGPIPYRGRACTGRAWKRAFPGATSDQVRAFLRCLVDGMGITRAATLKFHPQDQVLDIYRSLYGGRTPRGDQMECECFLEDIAGAFQTTTEELVEAWHREVTLGELFIVATEA